MYNFVSYAVHRETGSRHVTTVQQIKHVPRAALVEVMRVLNVGGYPESLHFPRSAFRGADGRIGKGARLNYGDTESEAKLATNLSKCVGILCPPDTQQVPDDQGTVATKINRRRRRPRKDLLSK